MMMMMSQNMQMQQMMLQQMMSSSTAPGLQTSEKPAHNKYVLQHKNLIDQS